MTQLAMPWSDPRVGASRKRGTVTEKQAAKTCDTQRQRDVLLRELRSTTVGRTCDELEAVTGIPRYIAASRLGQMRKDRLCEPFGSRENQSGRMVQVWWALTVPRVVSVDVGERL